MGNHVISFKIQQPTAVELPKLLIIQPHQAQPIATAVLHFLQTWMNPLFPKAAKWEANQTEKRVQLVSVIPALQGVGKILLVHFPLQFYDSMILNTLLSI